MANVTVSVPVSNVTVSSTNNIVSVGTTTSNIIVSSSALLSNADVRAAISVVDAGGDGSLAYDQANGIITYTGPSASEVRTHFSAVSPATYSSATGVIGVDSSAVFASQTTDALAEGSSNLYYTQARFNSAFGAKTTDDLPQGATNKYFSTTLANSAIAAYTGSMSNMTGNIVTTANISGADLLASSNITATGNISAVHGTFTGATSVTATGNVSIGGNLNVTGNINSETVVDLFVEDRNITLQYGAVGAPSANSQIFVDRGSSANTYILWNEGTDRWNFSNDGSTEFVLPTSTSDIAEGTNLYLNGTGTTDNLTEGTTNLYFSNARVLAGVTAGNVKLKNFSETDHFNDVPNSGNITLDVANGTIHRVPVTGNITGIQLDNLTLGGSMQIYFDNSSGYSLDTTTHASNWSDWYFADNIKDITTAVANGFPQSVMTVVAGYKSASSLNYIASIVDVGEDAGAVPGAIQGNITLNTNETTDQDAYIFANRPVAGSNVSIRWNETTDNWELTNDGTTFNAITTSASGDITEVVAGNGLSGGGTSGAVTVTLDTSSSTFVDGAEAIFSVSTSAASSGGALSYDNTSGLFTFTPADVQTDAEVRGLLSVTQNSASGTGALSYDNSTGVFTYTPPVLPTGDITGVTAGNGLSGGGTSGDVTVTLDTSSSTFIDGAEAIFSVTTNSASGAGALAYDNTSGVFTFTPADAVTTATTATNATNVVITDDTSQDATHYVTFSAATSGNNPLEVSSSKLYFNPADGDLTVGNNITFAKGHVSKIQPASSTNFVVEEPFGSSNTLTNSVEVDGAGYKFTPNNITAALEILSYSGSDTLTTYLFNGNVTSGSADITVTSMNDKQGDASVVVADVIKQYMAFGEAYLNSSQKPFPIGTYVQSVAGSVVTMSQNALADATFTDATFSPGAVDTTRNQVITITSDYAFSGGSNTSIKYQSPINNDAYGYPRTGFVVGDFAYSHGTSSDYTFTADQSAYFRGKTDVTPANIALNTNFGLTVGANTSMTSRGENDGLESFGVNVLWDGVSSQGYTSKIPQILMKSYTDNTLASSLPSNSGPRILFSSLKGKSTDYAFGQYPRANQELGRLAWWGPTGDNLAPSTIRPPAYISVQAHNDWDDDSTVAGNADMYISSTSNHTSGSDVFVAYKHGELILSSGKNTAENHKSVSIAPTQQPGNNPGSAFGTNYTKWAEFNYEDLSGDTGSELLITNGGSTGAGTVGNLSMGLKRNDVSGSATIDVPVVLSGDYWSALGGAAGEVWVQFPNAQGVGSSLDGVAFTFTGTGTDGIFGSGNESNLPSSTTYYFDFIYSTASQDGYAIMTDSGLTTHLTYSDIGGSDTGNNYAPQTALTATYSVSSGVTGKEWTLSMAEQSDNLVLKGNTTSVATFTSTRTEFDLSAKLKNYTTTEIQALSGPSAGDTVYNTTEGTICFHNGTSWQKVNHANL